MSLNASTCLFALAASAVALAYITTKRRDNTTASYDKNNGGGITFLGQKKNRGDGSRRHHSAATVAGYVPHRGGQRFYPGSPSRLYWQHQALYPYAYDYNYEYTYPYWGDAYYAPPSPYLTGYYPGFF